MGVCARFLDTPRSVGPAFIGIGGLLMRAVALTLDEVGRLMARLMTSREPPPGTTGLTDWLNDNADGLSRRYVSELWRIY